MNLHPCWDDEESEEDGEEADEEFAAPRSRVIRQDISRLKRYVPTQATVHDRSGCLPSPPPALLIIIAIASFVIILLSTPINRPISNDLPKTPMPPPQGEPLNPSVKWHVNTIDVGLQYYVVQGNIARFDLRYMGGSDQITSNFRYKAYVIEGDNVRNLFASSSGNPCQRTPQDNFFALSSLDSGFVDCKISYDIEASLPLLTSRRVMNLFVEVATLEPEQHAYWKIEIETKR